MLFKRKAKIDFTVEDKPMGMRRKSWTNVLIDLFLSFRKTKALKVTRVTLEKPVRKYGILQRLTNLPFITTVDKYILKECAIPFVVGTFFFTFVFVIERLRTLVEMIVEKNTPFDISVQLFVYMLPFTMALTIPMGVLFGVLMAFGRLSGNAEVIAMRAGGISIYRIFRPVLLFGILVMAFMFYFVNWIMPETNHRYKTLFRAVMYSNPGIMLQSRVFSEIPGSNKKISTLEVSRDGQTMTSVFIYEYDNENQKIKITYAEHGQWKNNELNSPLITLLLKNGHSLEMSMVDYSEIQSLHFEEIAFNIVTESRGFNQEEKGLREVSAFEIRNMILERTRNNQKVYPNMWVEYHKKFSIPVACFVFVIVGMPLGISFARGGRGVSFGMAIVVLFIYYILMTTGETLGKRELIPPPIAMWVPNLVLFSAGVYFFFMRARE